LADLIREGVGPFCLQTAVAVDRLSTGDPQPLQGIELAVRDLPVRRLTDQECARVAAGGMVPAQEVQGEEIAGLDGQGRLRAILVPRSAGQLGPVRNFRNMPTR
jgi:hypothetical protein